MGCTPSCVRADGEPPTHFKGRQLSTPHTPYVASTPPSSVLPAQGPTTDLTLQGTPPQPLHPVHPGDGCSTPVQPTWPHHFQQLHTPVPSSTVQPSYSPGAPGVAQSLTPWSTLSHTSGRHHSSAAGYDDRRLVLIVWDIENVRLPLNTGPGMSPKDVVRYLKHCFIEAEGKQEYKVVTCVTKHSLTSMERDHPNFVDEVITDMNVLLASALHAKRNADVSLKREISYFTHEFANQAKSRPGEMTIVLLTGDEDFLEPVQRALQQGFDVRLVHHNNASSRLLQQAYRRPPVLWTEFLRDQSGHQHVVLPYGDVELHHLLKPGCLVVCGFPAKWRSGRAHDVVVRSLPAAPSPAGIQMVQPAMGEHTGPCIAVVSYPEDSDLVSIRQALLGQHKGLPLKAFPSAHLAHLELGASVASVAASAGKAKHADGVRGMYHALDSAASDITAAAKGAGAWVLCKYSTRPSQSQMVVNALVGHDAQQGLQTFLARLQQQVQPSLRERLGVVVMVKPGLVSPPPPPPTPPPPPPPSSSTSTTTPATKPPPTTTRTPALGAQASVAGVGSAVSSRAVAELDPGIAADAAGAGAGTSSSAPVELQSLPCLTKQSSGVTPKERKPWKRQNQNQEEQQQPVPAGKGKKNQGKKKANKIHPDVKALAPANAELDYTGQQQQRQQQQQTVRTSLQKLAPGAPSPSPRKSDALSADPEVQLGKACSTAMTGPAVWEVVDRGGSARNGLSAGKPGPRGPGNSREAGESLDHCTGMGTGMGTGMLGHASAVIHVPGSGCRWEGADNGYVTASSGVFDG